MSKRQAVSGESDKSEKKKAEGHFKVAEKKLTLTGLCFTSWTRQKTTQPGVGPAVGLLILTTVRSLKRTMPCGKLFSVVRFK